MNRENLKIAVAEARRFLDKVEQLPEPEPYTEAHMQGLMHDNYPKQQGAIRRASMDLSRALTELRKP